MKRNRKRTGGGEDTFSPNWENRTLFHGDNLGFLRAMNSRSVDLIATDPPFNKGRDFHATPDSLADGASFQDRWSWERDVHQEWIDKIKDDFPKVKEVYESAMAAHSSALAAFLCFMAVRLFEMHRVLKSTGSIYLHCDPTASHYIKAMMDAIFGWKNFRNEIVWFYNDTPGRPKSDFPRKHDLILRYTKTGNWVFNGDDVKVPILEASKQRYEYERELGGRRKIGGDTSGKIPEDVWPIPSVKGKDRYGYPTQKPIALYERIIRASSNPGDIVLDPFCGCATTLVAAERLKRQWVGIDIWNKAHNAVVKRLANDTNLEVPAGFHEDLRLYYDGQIHYEKTPPERDDDREEAVPFMLTIQTRKKEKEPWENMSRAEITKELEKAQGTPDGFVVCAGCGRKVELPFMELDHIQPRSERGKNDISNRILLCGPCNKRKSNRLTLAGLLSENKKENWIKDRKLADKAKNDAYAHYVKIKEGRIQWEGQKT